MFKDIWTKFEELMQSVKSTHVDITTSPVRAEAKNLLNIIGDRPASSVSWRRKNGGPNSQDRNYATPSPVRSNKIFR